MNYYLRSPFYIYLITLILSNSLLLSCVKPEVKNNLCQSWQYNLAATRIELENRGVADKTKELMETWMIEKQFTVLKFSADGTFQMKWRELLTEGSWRFKKRTF